VKRLAVAVVVNYKKLTDAKGQTTSKPLSETEINQITELVKQVMAYDKERGDTVSVMNSAFNAGEKEKFADTPLWKQPETIETAKMIGKNVLIAGVLLFIIMGVLKPMLKTLAESRPSPALGEGGDAQQLLSANYQQRVERAKQLARNDPKAVATVVKDWVSDGK
jgi:flagellar M-ring protein FliF